MRIVITAGDPSADVHAARLMAAIRARVPDVVFEGFGGVAMEMEGLHTIAHMRDLAVTGFWEVAKRGRYFTSLLQKAASLLDRRRVQLFIPVDYPGFNLRLAAKSKASGVPVAWYIAPQLWAWGKNRAKGLANVVDELLVVFPFEVEFFSRFGIHATWVGHPFIPPTKPLPRNTSPTVVLMPGSRKQELRHHVPLLAQVVKQLPQTLGYSPSMVVPRASMVEKGALVSLENAGAQVVDSAHDAMQYGTAGLIKAGTSTLEAALSGLPFATFYKTSMLSYWIGKNLVNVDTVTMMNLLLQRNVVHEYIQHGASASTLVAELAELLENTSRQQELNAAMSQVRSLLGVGMQGGPSAAERAADVIVQRFL